MEDLRGELEDAQLAQSRLQHQVDTLHGQLDDTQAAAAAATTTATNADDLIHHTESLRAAAERER